MDASTGQSHKEKTIKELISVRRKRNSKITIVWAKKLPSA